MSGEKVVITNRKARHDYVISDTVEAGIALTGTEVKSLRSARANIRDAYGKVENGEVFLYNFHISPYEHGNIYNHDPLRVRKLLLHREEIRRLFTKTEQRGFTLIPLRVYFRRGYAKVELGVARGKLKYDKRQQVERREAEREVRRVMRSRRRSA